MRNSQSALDQMGLLAAATFAVFLASVATVSAQTGAADGSCTDGEDQTPLATLAWKEVPDAGTLAETKGVVHLTATNPGSSPVDVHVSVLIDSGGPESAASGITVRALAPRATQEIALDLEKLRPKPKVQEFAGQLLARARVNPPGACDGGACEASTDEDDTGDDAELFVDETRSGGVGGDGSVKVETASTPPLYFHKTKGRFLVYGADVLVDRFGAGDLGRPTASDPDASLERVSSGGRAIEDDARFASEAAIASLDDEHAPGGIARASAPQAPVPSNAYRLCIKWEIGLDDAGRVITTPEGVKVTEDFWHGSPNLPGNGFSPFGTVLTTTPGVHDNMLVTGRGVVIRVTRGDWSQEFDTDPATGCVTFVPPNGTGAFKVTAYSHHRDARGNQIRVEASNGTRFGFAKFYTIDPGTTRVASFGGYGPTATLAATTGFLMYRSSFGNTNKTIKVKATDFCGKPGGAESSAHFKFDELAEGIAHVRVHPGFVTCSLQDHRRLKFLVGHEIGHAWQLLAMGIEAEEPGMDYSFVDDPPTETICDVGSLYSLGSVEWSSVGAREGLAHFYATEAWNRHSSGNAVFTWFGASFGYDVERHNPHQKGGRLFLRCDGTYTRYGLGTNLDWLRFYWDVHTPFKVGTRFSVADISAIYENAIKNGEVDRESYYHEMRKAAGDLVDQKGYSDSLRASFAFHACFNGVATSSLAGNIPCDEPFAYPDCEFANPEDGAGLQGCPCKDVVSSLNDSTLETDGYYSDGPGSYLRNGFFGPGQSCTDEQIGLPNRSVCGRAPSLGSHVPVCKVCEEDTMWGCPCFTDDACDALGADGVPLSCIGSPESGFAGGEPGVCLPTPDTAARRTLLVDQPWFCLDNCGAKESTEGTSVCLFDQFVDDPQTHGECVSTVCSGPIGACELGGEICDVNQDSCSGGSCCVSECLDSSDCSAFHGFPDHYECDIANGIGKCVPQGCGSVKTFDASYCALYR